jgi:outer membrane protein assembly factor BamE
MVLSGPVGSGLLRARVVRAVILLTLVGLLSGCGGWWRAYRIDVQQGNNIDPVVASRLRVGMTRDQVRFLLGTPLVADIFHADRWDYVYRRQANASAPVEMRRLVVFFKADVLERVEGEGFPEGALVLPTASPGSAGDAPPQEAR